MNLRIPLIVFAVASVMTASTAIAAMSIQKVYAPTEPVWCIIHSHDCWHGEGAQDKCNAWREAELKKQQEASDIGFGTVGSCVKQD